jgi:CheY-like chemotaxis protein
MTILYVEDDPEDQDIFREAIEVVAPHTTCHFARNGDDAFRLISKMVIEPDYIFLDINMPEMNGKEFLKKLKATARLRGIPVIIYSTSNTQRDMEECKNLGAIEFITKPSDFTLICTMLKNFL